MPPEQATEPSGLSEAEATSRRARGEGNDATIGPSRTYLAIVRSNLFSFFNNILFAIGIALIALGRLNDAITSVGLGMLIAVIGTVQEFRARRQLDRIAILNRPEVRVMRDGRERPAAPAEIVLGDIIRLKAGDQVVADGVLVGTGAVELDESLLTGEATAVARSPGDQILSGSVCVSGSGAYRADKVGVESYANGLTLKARAFRLGRTPLQQQIDTTVRLAMLVVALLAGPILAAAFLEGQPTVRFVQVAAVLSGLVPYGMFFVVVLAYAVSAASLARRGALVQQVEAVESLSEADVLCLDKTGTLTTNRLVFDAVHPIGGREEAEVRRLLGVVAASGGSVNATSAAIATALPQPRIEPADEVPFSSDRKWSAVSFEGAFSGVFALGAYDMLKRHLADPPADLAETVRKLASSGLRVLLFAGAPGGPLHDGDGRPTLPPLAPLGLVAIGDELRSDVRETLAGFAALGIRVKVISGDDPNTVAAVARQAGLAGDLVLASGPDLEVLGDAAFAAGIDEATIFGRISPAQKERIVRVLMARGLHVAMIGDGVNDVLALREAQLGIAMKSGSAAARNVADMVLINDDFAPLRSAFEEGHRVRTGMGGAMLLFVARVAASILLVIGMTMLALPFPFEPSHVGLTLFTVGIPTSLLVLWAKPEPAIGSLPRRLVSFVAPAAIVTMAAGMAVFTISYNDMAARIAAGTFGDGYAAAVERLTGFALAASDSYTRAAAGAFAQSALSTFLTFTGFLLVLFVAPPARVFLGWTDRLAADRRMALLVAGLAAVFAAVMFVRPLAEYFGLLHAPGSTYLVLLVALFAWAVVLGAAWRGRWLERFLHIGPRPRTAPDAGPMALGDPPRPSGPAETDEKRRSPAEGATEG
ncbi:MAG: HAD-IC family P-type ATPase [Bauldia sp.]|nr:HAD-IC family P-type ATPase [Bauldia sp.]